MEINRSTGNLSLTQQSESREALDAGYQGYNFWKRTIDIVLASSGLLIAAPLLLLIAFAIVVESPGPILFRQSRLGKWGHLFGCWKFRSMHVDAEDRLRQDPELWARYRENFKVDRDPRVTKIGHFLRRTSLDELPQLYNVLVGEMSLVGPRPILPEELAKYHIYQDKLLSVKPGMTGLWQISGRSDTTYAQRVRLDIQYIDQRSIVNDAKISLLTLPAVLGRRGAY